MINFSKSPNKTLNLPGVYLIKINSHFYIGSSICVGKRIKQHRSKLKSLMHENRFMQTVYNKYKVHKSYYCLLESCDASIRLHREKYWINVLTPDMNSKMDPLTQQNSKTQSKIVYCYTLEGKYIGFYPSVSEAERILGISGTSISNTARGNGNCKSAGGYLWSYKKEENLIYKNLSSKAKIRVVTMFSKTGEKLKTFNSIIEAARFLQESNENLFSLGATISSAAKNQSYSVKDKYLFCYGEKDFILNTASKNYPILQKEIKSGKEILWNSCGEAARILKIKTTGINRVLKGQRKSYKESIWSDARIKQGELLETPTLERQKEDNQQPSLSSNTLEGSTTNSQIQTDNAEDSNGNTSALPIWISEINLTHLLKG